MMFAQIKVTLLLYSLSFLHIHIGVGEFTNEPANVTTCAGTNVTLNWRFESETELDVAEWIRNGKFIMRKYDSQAAIPSDGVTNVEHITNGEIKIIRVMRPDAGTYELRVFYNLDSKLDTLSGTVSVTVLMAPSAPTFEVNRLGEEDIYLCETNSTGMPSVDIRIKIGGDLLSSSSSAVDYTQNISCCVVGEASRCISENKNNVTEYCKSVMTPSGPDNMKITPNGTNYTLDVGEKLGLICSATCEPPCTFSWTKDSTPIVTVHNGSLLINVQDKNDGGIYICTAKRGTSITDARAIKVHVRYGPETASFVPAGRTFTENENTSFSINCTSECYPGCMFTWIKQGDQPNIASSTLSFKLMKRDDVGKYVCEVQNTHSSSRYSATATATVFVRYGPDDLRLLPKDISATIDEGQILPDITCVSDCYPGCSEYWLNVTSNDKIGNGSILALKTVYRNFTGEYKCISTNDAHQFQKNSSVSVNLTVRYFPDVVMDQLDDVTEHNESLRINCTVNAEPAVTFYNFIHLAPDGKTKVQEYKGSEQNGMFILNLRNISYMDSGIYICQVSNGIQDYKTNKSNATDEIDILIKDKPFIADAERIVDAAVGSDISLNVSFFSNDGSESNVRWFRLPNNSRSEILAEEKLKYSFLTFMDNVDVPYHTVNINQRGNTTQLKIKNINQLDLINYMVEISNNIGVSNYFITLSPRGAPEEPYNIIVMDGSRTASSITLTWYSGFHGGADQTFHVLFKTNYSEWQEWSNIYGGKNTDKQFNETVAELHQNTLYWFLVYAKNEYGSRNSSVIVYAKTTPVRTGKEDSHTAAAVGGGVGGGFVIVALVFGVFLMRKRTKIHRKKDDVKRLNASSSRNEEKTETDFEVNLNPMYESAGDVPSASNNNIYAKVKKPLKKDDSTFSADKHLYADAKKPKQQEDSNRKPKKKKKEKPGTKAKLDKTKDGMVYENAASLKGQSNEENYVYENPSCNTLGETSRPEPSRTKNQDGLIYVEVEVPTTEDNTDRKPIIHGLEDRNDYAEIAFGKVGEPAPESDGDDKKE